MVTFNVNGIMEKLMAGEISRKEAIDSCLTFVSENYKIFGLNEYDEDFRSDLILTLLERGDKILDSYRPELGDFFNYLYMVVESQKLRKLRVRAHKKVKESFIMQAGPLYLSEKQISYASYTLTPLPPDSPKRPYVYKPISPELVRQTLTKAAHENKNKKLLILAIKTSFYLTDKQISAVSKIYKINENHFQQIIQFFRDQLQEKADRKMKLQERRNCAYFHQKNYEKRLELIKESEKHYDNIDLLETMEHIFNKHYRSWQNLNRRLTKGCILIRPTNKMIGDYLGICERRIAYYLSRCKDEVE
ncbi:MAG: hypothetical protein K5681_03275 [Treponema sp.]|nr:hypothetical protein [Treponema sp.]